LPQLPLQPVAAAPPPPPKRPRTRAAVAKQQKQDAEAQFEYMQRNFRLSRQEERRLRKELGL
jgi:hypothetical protein